MYLDRRADDSMCTQVDLVTRFDLGVLPGDFYQFEFQRT